MEFTTLENCINNFSFYCIDLVNICVGKDEFSQKDKVCSELASGCYDRVLKLTSFCNFFLNKCYPLGVVYNKKSLYDCVGIDNKYNNEYINQNNDFLFYLLAGALGFVISFSLLVLAVHKFMNRETNPIYLRLRREVVPDDFEEIDNNIEDLVFDFNKISDNQKTLDKLNHNFELLGLELKDPPDEYCCPISQQLMDDPVLFIPASNNENNNNIKTYKNVSYERGYINHHFKVNGNFCPLTRIEIEPGLLIPDVFLKEGILDWLNDLNQELISDLSNKTDGSYLSLNELINKSHRRNIKKINNYELQMDI